MMGSIGTASKGPGLSLDRGGPGPYNFPMKTGGISDMEQNRRVLVAMSGGVDSSAAVCLLKEQGYACVGVTMKLLGGPPGGEEDAREAARRMQIPHNVLD